MIDPAAEVIEEAIAITAQAAYDEELAATEAAFQAEREESLGWGGSEFID